jgi:hypothetical protein
MDDLADPYGNRNDNGFRFINDEKIRSLDSKIVMDDPKGGLFNSDHRAILLKLLIDTNQAWE